MLVNLGGASLAAVAAGVVAAATAAPALVAAASERPPDAPVPRAVVLVALTSALAFLGVAALTLAARDAAGAGLLAASAELSAAAAIWCLRAPHDDGGGGGGPPTDPRVPDEYWRRWEEDLREPAGLSTRGRPRS